MRKDERVICLRPRRASSASLALEQLGRKPIVATKADKAEYTYRAGGPMQSAFKLNVTIDQNHTVRLPENVPVGPAEIIVLVDPPEASRRRADLADRRRRALGAAVGQFTVPDDFDDPLPAEILRHFEDSDIEPNGA